VPAVDTRASPLTATSEARRLSPEEALAAVVWPLSERLADEHVPLGKQVYADEVREGSAGATLSGKTTPELVLKTSIPYAQVKFLCSEAGAERVAAVLKTPRYLQRYHEGRPGVPKDSYREEKTGRFQRVLRSG
jgi:hypothetical protein